MALHTLFLPRRRMSLQSVNCSSVNSCLESKSLNSSIGKLMISRTLIGKLKPNARRSSRDSCDTLIPGGKPAMLAAASAAKDFRFRSLLEDPDPEPEGPGNPADDELADIVDPMWAIWPPEIKLSFGGKIQIGNFGGKIVYHVGSFGADDVGDVVKDGHAKNELKCWHPGIRTDSELPDFHHNRKNQILWPPRQQRQLKRPRPQLRPKFHLNLSLICSMFR